MGAGIQPGGLAGMANAPAVGRHGQQGIPHNMGEAPGQWQGLPRHQNDTAPPAFQGQALAGLNNAGAGPQGQEHHGCWYPTGGTGGHGKCTGCGKESNYIN